MEVNILNLSRKWRSQNFDQIVGQEIVVRILKNSLYLGHYFPVYLFAGQRGCGKTSTARVFAAALNCQALDNFKKNPKESTIPCLICASCVAMRDGKHPDFIEIDAASHTGVDNIRTIIESSSLLPLLGRKRVYLIDEAHMLSKAAFNAALKILEEPSPSALFILATTNHHKIIDTVRSRCFQLFFNAIAQNPLSKHLQDICKKEGIVYKQDALAVIAEQTDGSARDALNLLEQVRFSSSVVTKEAVLQLLGHMSDQHIIQIIDVTLCGSVKELLSLIIRLNMFQYAADYIWQRLMTVLRALVWMKHGVNPDTIIAVSVALQSLEKRYSLTDIQDMISVLYEHEELFLKTKMQHILLERVLLAVCQGKKKLHNEGQGPAQHGMSSEFLIEGDKEDNSSDAIVDNGYVETAKVHDATTSEDGSDDARWIQFLDRIESTVQDPLVRSLFKQSFFISYQEKKVSVEFLKDLALFQDMLHGACSVWQPLLDDIFGLGTILQFQFSLARATEAGIKKSVQPKVAELSGEIEKKKIIQVQQKQHYKPFVQRATITQRSLHINECRVDVSDESEWKMSAMLLRHFPGIITEVRENR